MKILSKNRQIKLLFALIVCIIMIGCGFAYRMIHKEEIAETTKIQIENELKVFSSMYYETEFYSSKTKEQLVLLNLNVMRIKLMLQYIQKVHLECTIIL